MIARRDFFFGTALTLAGCASPPPPEYFRLAAIPGPVQPSAPFAISVRSVGIPGYLDQSGVVKFSGTYQFDTYDNQLWAAPLAAMLQAVMVENLAQRLPAATVLAAGGAIEAPADVLVELNLLRFDPDAEGNMVLLAQIAIKAGKDRKLLLARTLQAEQPAAAGASGTAAAMSQLWAQAAGEIAAMALTCWASHGGATDPG
jgi:uncharacterized lipoprotein YmbA